MNVLTSYRMSGNFGTLDYIFLLFFSLVYIITELRPVLWFHWHHETRDKPINIDAKSKSSRVKTVSDIPGPTPRIPILGTRWIFSSVFGKYKLNKIFDAYTDLFNKHGPVIREEALWNFPVISLINRDDIEKVYRYPTKWPLRPPTEITVHYRTSRPDRYTDSGIVNEQGANWERLRQNLTPELKSLQTIKLFVPDLTQIAEDFTVLLRQKRDAVTGNVNSFEEVAKVLGLESTCMLILGRRLGFLEQEVDARTIQLAAAVKGHFCASRETYYGLPFWKFLPTQTYSLYVESEEKIYDIISSFVEQTLGKEGDTCADTATQCVFMSVLQAHGLDIRDKKSAIIDFIAAGIHTMGNTIVFLMYLMAKHPEVQQRLYDELKDLAPEGTTLTYNHLKNAKYLKACVVESTRLLPTAPCVARILEATMELGGYQCPPGTVVLCHSWLACLKEENFTDAKSFRPERWLPENKHTMKSAPFIFAPFGVGRRSCPGKRFVDQALHLILAKIVQEFHIGYEGELDLQFEFLLVPQTPANFTFTDRV